MGAILSVVNDNFIKEKEYGYIKDSILESVIEKSQDQSFDCLSYVLIYENTLFNSLQMDEIKKELVILSGCFDDQEILEILLNIEKAIDFAKKDPPLYLLFEGD